MAFTQAGPELLLDARDTEMNKMYSSMGKTEKMPKSASQRNCSAAELYTLYTGLCGFFSDKVMCNMRLEGGVGVYHPGRPLHSR